MDENLKTTENPVEETENYVDYVVEDDFFPKQNKKPSVCKILTMVFGIIAGLCLLYYSVDVLRANLSQINQYKQMGVEIPGISLFVVYLQIGMMFIGALSSIVGGVLPRRFARTSVLLLAIPSSWALINGLPQFIMNIAYKTPFAQSYQGILVAASGILTLAAAIISLFVYEYYDCDCDCCEDYECGCGCECESENSEEASEDIPTEENVDEDEQVAKEAPAEESNNDSEKAPEENTEEE